VAFLKPVKPTWETKRFSTSAAAPAAAAAAATAAAIASSGRPVRCKCSVYTCSNMLKSVSRQAHLMKYKQTLS